MEGQRKREKKERKVQLFFQKGHVVKWHHALLTNQLSGVSLMDFIVTGYKSSPQPPATLLRRRKATIPSLPGKSCAEFDTF
jgi:hypothetical protein